MVKSLVSIEDLSDDDLEALFDLADHFLEEMKDESRPFRVRGRRQLADDQILATLFHEPSTRTRLSFESAMIRLGGHIISSPDGKSTSAVKGESIADTVRVVENYADAIVIRHPWEGAAQVAADYTAVPVINAGDGSHEHPTQTLCDLYTLRAAQQSRRGRSKKDAKRKRQSLRELLGGLTVVLAGDLHHGRTVHSLVYALARLGVSILPAPATSEYDFPAHVRRRLARDYQCVSVPCAALADEFPGDVPADYLYITPEKSHQLSLWEQPPDELIRKWTRRVDVVYATRVQEERRVGEEVPPRARVINTEFLTKSAYKDSRIMHPLPRVDELSYDLDNDKRSMYFRQAAYGVPVRMALIAGLLELRPGLIAAEGRQGRYPVYARREGIACTNPRCVTSQESERRYLSQKFWIVDDQELTVRCAYCDFEQEPKVIARASTRKYHTETRRWKSIGQKNLVFFADEAQAREAGYEPQHAPLRSETECGAGV